MCCRRLTKAKSGGLACHPAVPQHAVLGEGLRQTIRKVHTCNEAHGGCCLGERQMTPETTTPRTCSSWAGWKTAAPCKCRWAAMPSLHATSAGKHIQSTHLFHIPVRNACGAQHKATAEASGHTCSLAAGLRPTCSCACAARLDPCPAHQAAGCPPTAWRQTWWPASLQRSERSGGQGAAQAASGGSAAAVRAEAAERSAPPSTHATTRSSIWAGSQPLFRGMPWQSCCCSAKRGAAQHERDVTQTLSPCKRVPNLQTPTRAGRARAAGSAAGGGLHGLPTNKAIAHCEQDAAIGRKEAPACAGA